jgi:hypothetical protein
MRYHYEPSTLHPGQMYGFWQTYDGVKREAEAVTDYYQLKKEQAKKRLHSSSTHPRTGRVE